MRARMDGCRRSPRSSIRKAIGKKKASIVSLIEVSILGHLHISARKPAVSHPFL